MPTNLPQAVWRDEVEADVGASVSDAVHGSLAVGVLLLLVGGSRHACRRNMGLKEPE